MSSASKIEWTEATWNPIVGCSIVSPGCTNCYAMRMAARIEAMSDAANSIGAGRPVSGYSAYTGTTKRVNGHAVWTGELGANAQAMLAPLRRRKPTTYFVNSMGDLFHENCPDRWIDQAFAVMALCTQHTFQILTKRAARMREYFANPERALRIDGETWSLLGAPEGSKVKHGGNWRAVLPLKNVWLGVSTERQQEADERIPELLATPAAVRFISAEPLLGNINLTRVHVAGHGWQDVLSGWRECKDYPGRENTLDWVICGGESGPGARPMHPRWARALRNQCANATMPVPFFFKQWGEYGPCELHPPGTAVCSVITRDGRHLTGADAVIGAPEDSFAEIVARFGKAKAGRKLDGVEHNAMPEPEPHHA